jgi:hypothetical protein
MQALVESSDPSPIELISAEQAVLDKIAADERASALYTQLMLGSASKHCLNNHRNCSYPHS